MTNKKMINLIVSSNLYPYILEIYTCDGQFLGRRTINQQNSFVLFCTKTCCIKVVAKYCNQVQLTKKFLSCSRCQRIFANFNFKEINHRPKIQNFRLTDANYNLPVPQAILNFVDN